jgi:tRNA-Thr(GGU) m(6)t(6)A37 methyltransferase TsaA
LLKISDQPVRLFRAPPNLKVFGSTLQATGVFFERIRLTVKGKLMAAYAFSPIGIIRSCFTEKFGIPRQSGLVPQIPATLEILPEFQQREAFRGLEQFSHLWLLFVFHANARQPWKTTVRPPRLGGNRRVGVFASRSGFRPNPIGQSLVTLLKIEAGNRRLVIHLGGADLLDGTPVLDIKPYLPYADSLPAASCGYAREAPPAVLSVSFNEQARATCRALEKEHPGLQDLIQGLLTLDPRPAYHADHKPRDVYGMRLWDFNVRFRITGNHAVVEGIDAFDKS